MRKERATILYLFITLIIIIGVVLFIFKDSIINQYLNYGGSDEIVKVTPGASIFNLDVLRDSRVKALKNYVSTFNYEDLNKTQDLLQAAQQSQGEVIISNPDDTSSSTEGVVTKTNFVRVRVGNTNPFVVNKVVAK